jgi:methionine salvage enolase-phosphatase E1
MGRPKKKEISLNKDSVLSLMQEIYNELVEQRATAVRIQNKMLAMLKDPKDMTVIGPVIKEQQKIINDTIEKKLSLSKLQSSIWEKSNNTSEESFNISDMDDDILSALIEKDSDTSKGDSEGYKLE